MRLATFFCAAILFANTPVAAQSFAGEYEPLRGREHWGLSVKESRKSTEIHLHVEGELTDVRSGYNRKTVEIRQVTSCQSKQSKYQRVTCLVKDAGDPVLCKVPKATYVLQSKLDINDIDRTVCVKVDHGYLVLNFIGVGTDSMRKIK
jgi:hypothetical protein